MTHPTTTRTHDTREAQVREARARPTRPRAPRLAARLARWLALGASAVALLRGVVELVAAWRAL